MDFSVIIIGSGQAGVPLAARLAAAGRTVLLAERGDVGGTCVNAGCTPTKTMVASARAAHVARTSARLGVHAGAVKIDFPAIVRRKDQIVQRWRDGVGRRLQANGLTLARGHARFAGDGRVQVGGEVHEAEKVIVNVGTRPVVPAIDGLADVPFLNNRTVMALHQLPEHLLIIGGGYIGCEFGQMFRRFGAQVTIVQSGAHLLSREDPEISASLEEVFRREGIVLHLGANALRVSGREGAIAVQLDTAATVRGSHLLVATGRRPNTDDLGCGEAGIELDAKGFIVADDEYRTSVRGVYAVGDVLGGPQFTHTSWDDHRLLFDILTGRPHRGRHGRFVPYTVFTDPQVAAVGLNERTAREQGVRFESATMQFGVVARAIETDETAGVMKVLIDPSTERVLGAAIVGAEAGELIHVFVALMQAGAPARAIVDAQFVHPTFAEGVQSLVMKIPRFALR